MGVGVSTWGWGQRAAMGTGDHSLSGVAGVHAGSRRARLPPFSPSSECHAKLVALTELQRKDNFPFKNISGLQQVTQRREAMHSVW